MKIFKTFILNPLILILILLYSLPASCIITALQFIKLWGKSYQDTTIQIMNQLGFLKQKPAPDIKPIKRAK